MTIERNLVITNPVSGEGFRVIDAASPEFMCEVNKLLDVDAVAKASPFLSNSVVIENNTGRYIWGFTVIYTFPDRIAPSGDPWRVRISPSPGGAAPRHCMLAPGGRWLITPVSDFYAARDGKGRRNLQPYLDETTDDRIAFYLSLHGNDRERIYLAVDSVIFEDGALEGPDTAETGSKVNSWIKADEDLISSLANARGDQLRLQLEKLSGAKRKDEYSGRLANIAGLLLQQLNNDGEDVVIQQLELMKAARWFPNPGRVQRKVQ